MFRIISKAAIEPDLVLSLRAAKEHLEIVEDDWNEQIAELIKAAIGLTERYGKISLAAREYTVAFDCFSPIMRLPIEPAGAVSEILYFDTAGIEQELDAAAYVQSGNRIQAARAAAWPATDGRIGGISIKYNAGYAAVGDDEPLLVSAVKLTVGDLFMNRESSPKRLTLDMPNSARALVDLVRTPTI